jgi:hypothetical protein
MIYVLSFPLWPGKNVTPIDYSLLLAKSEFKLEQNIRLSVAALKMS